MHILKVPLAALVLLFGLSLQAATLEDLSKIVGRDGVSVRELKASPGLFKLAERLQNSEIEGRLFAIRGPLKPLEFPQQLENEYRHCVVRKLKDNELRFEAAVVLDVLLPSANWSTYTQALTEIEAWGKNSDGRRQIFRLEPGGPAGQHSLWLVDYQNGMILVLRLR